MIWTRKQFDKAFLDNLSAIGLNTAENFDVIEDKNYILKENKVWFKGESSEILRFYKTLNKKNWLSYSNNFYKLVNTDEYDQKSVMHYNLPNIITNTMSNLLFNDMPDIQIDYATKRKTKELSELLMNIVDNNDGLQLLQDAAKLQSYSGAVAFKLVVDKGFSDYPLYIPYPKEDIEIEKKYGKVVEIIFKDYYEKGNYIYTLCSVYGKGYVNYKLFLKDKEVPLTEIEETSKLKDFTVYNSDGTQSKELLAVYIENKQDAKSDYRGCIDDFIAYDEIYTNMIDLTRKAGPIEYIPESLGVLDTRTDKRNIPSTWNHSIVPLYDSNYKDTREKAERDIPDISNTLLAYKEEMNHILMNCLFTTGISPATIGMDLSGANSSGLALSIREKASIRTRDDKVHIWTVQLEKLFKLALEFSTIQKINDKFYFTLNDLNVSVRFPDYGVSESYQRLNELVDYISKAKDSDLMDIDTGLDILNREFYKKSPEELEIMKMNILGDLPDEKTIEEKELNKEDEIEMEEEMTEKDESEGDKE